MRIKIWRITEKKMERRMKAVRVRVKKEQLFHLHEKKLEKKD